MTRRPESWPSSRTRTAPKTQVVDAAYDVILTPEKWAAGALRAARVQDVFRDEHRPGLGRGRALASAARLGTAQPYLPGLNSGYIMAEYALRNLPLAKGEGYVFVGAPPFCANDAFQAIFDATVGKKGPLPCWPTRDS